MTPDTATSNRGSGRVAPVAWPPKLADLLHRRPELADVDMLGAHLTHAEVMGA